MRTESEKVALVEGLLDRALDRPEGEAEALALLRHSEWAASVWNGVSDVTGCWACQEPRDIGHTPTCRLALFLRAHPEQEPRP